MANFFGPKNINQGLSRLQKHILTVADSQGGEVLARDILVNYYGFKPYRNRQGLRSGAFVFRKSDRGPDQYNAAIVAVCKAFNRLCERGLARRIYGGVSIG